MRQFIPIHYAVLHYEDGMLQQSDILHRVAADSNNVRVLARFDAANAVRPAQKVGGIHCPTLDRLQRSHAQLYVFLELVSVQAVWIDGSIGAQGHFYPAGEGAAQVL